MTGPSTNAVVETSTPTTGAITVLVVTDDRQYGQRVESHFGDDDAFAVRTASSIANASSDIDDADCLVSEYALATRNGGALLDAVDRRTPDLPVLLLVDAAMSAAAVETVGSDPWVDCIDRHAATTSVERLAHQIRALLERRRLDALSRRSLAGVELAADAVAIVAPDGDLEFANRSFAMQFGYDREALVGRSWRTLFTDDSVDRLETAAIPTVADGWRWTGSCTGRRQSGATASVTVRLGGLEDGSLVFVVDTDGDGS